MIEHNTMNHMTASLSNATPRTRLKAFLFLLLACAVTAGLAEKDIDEKTTWKIPDNKSEFHVFALMGQSNMAGFGCANDKDPWQEGDKDPVPGVLILRGQCRVNEERPLRKIEWVPGSHRIHINQGTAQFGLGIDFAKSYQTNFAEKITVGLVPCAWGGAPINRLSKGTPIYNNAVKRLKIAAEKGTIKGVLWHQGESDTVSKKLAEGYEKKLTQLISDLRKDLGIKDLPFIIGDLAEFYGTSREHNNPRRRDWIRIVRGTLKDIPSKLPAVGFVSSTGLKSPDHHFVHFDRNSLVILGQRYAAEMTRLVPPPPKKKQVKAEEKN